MYYMAVLASVEGHQTSSVYPTFDMAQIWAFEHTTYHAVFIYGIRDGCIHEVYVMLVRQFVYGLLLEQRSTKTPAYLLVERLQVLIYRAGVWSNAEGISFVTGLHISLVEDIIKEGSVYCYAV